MSGLATNQAMLEMLERVGRPVHDHPILHEPFISLKRHTLRKLLKPSVHEIPTLLTALKDDVNCALTS